MEIFVITNGRSTFEYVTKCLAVQTLPLKITVVRDMKWIDALNTCLDKCNSTFFLRLDDDFLLHARTVEHMYTKVGSAVTANVGHFHFKLWETWTGRIIDGVKVYKTQSLRGVGGFVADDLGKVDKKTNARLLAGGYKLIGDSSIVGIHCCGKWEEQLRYEKLWSDLAKHSYLKTTHDEMKEFTMTLDTQMGLVEGHLESLNEKLDTEFNILCKLRRKDGK